MCSQICSISRESINKKQGEKGENKPNLSFSEGVDNALIPQELGKHSNLVTSENSLKKVQDMSCTPKKELPIERVKFEEFDSLNDDVLQRIKESVKGARLFNMNEKKKKESGSD